MVKVMTPEMVVVVEEEVVVILTGSEVDIFFRLLSVGVVAI